MSKSLSTKWFVHISSVVAIFCLVLVIGVVWLEIEEVTEGGQPLLRELSEIAMMLLVSACVFVLMLGGFWFVSKRMLRPIRSIAESAHRISEGNLRERLEDEDSSDEVRMLASTLNLAFDRYQEVVQRLDRFAGNAAHQLRTPLTSLRSMAEVCLQKQRSAGEYRECLENVLEAVNELADVVEKLLMIARMEPSRLRQHFSAVDVGEIVLQNIELFKASQSEKDIDLIAKVGAGLKVSGDAALLSQAISNLLDNALRHMPAHGRLEVTLKLHEGRVQFDVSDSGPGMPENVRRGLMEDGNLTGRGELPAGRLGLAIVSEIVRIHSGTLRVRSNEVGGTCVSLAWQPAARVQE